MMNLAVKGMAKRSAAANEPRHGLLGNMASGWLTILAVTILLTPFGANAQMSGTGAISGTVTDSTGAVIGGATVTATAVDQNTSTVRTTTGAGDYSITPLIPSIWAEGELDSGACA